MVKALAVTYPQRWVPWFLGKGEPHEDDLRQGKLTYLRLPGDRAGKRPRCTSLGEAHRQANNGGGLECDHHRRGLQQAAWGPVELTNYGFDLRYHNYARYQEPLSVTRKPEARVWRTAPGLRRTRWVPAAGARVQRAGSHHLPFGGKEH